MSFDALLIHRATIRRYVAVTDGMGDPVDDEMGQPERTAIDLATIACDIQPKTIREQAAVSGAGVTVGGWTMFMRPRDIDSADEIHHVAALCPVNPDLPDGTFQITGIRPYRDGAAMHHYEVDGELVASTQAVGS